MNEMPDLIIKLLSEGTDWPSVFMNFLGTVGGVVVGACGTYLLYNKERKDKERQQIQEFETEQVRAANELIIHLWTALSDAMSNNEIVDKQRNVLTTPDPHTDRAPYVVEANFDWNVVKEKSQYFIEKLPCLTLYATSLEESFKWSKIYRERRNKWLKLSDKSKYEGLCQDEYKNNNGLIKLLTAMLLVIYDYAVSRWKQNYTILKISKRETIVDVWKYLDEQFTKMYVEKSMQYEFQNPALVRWFFRMLKNECKKKLKANKTPKK